MRKSWDKGLVILAVLGLGWLWAAVVVGAEKGGSHQAPHGGVLNVIGKELGHIEVLVRDDVLEAWLLGGGQDTARSVPIKASEIALKVSIPGKGSKKLVLKADPLKLAGEGPGHCSHFVGRAEWLRGVKEFTAQGRVIFKGLAQELVIQYPEGYDPYHRHGDEHE